MISGGESKNPSQSDLISSISDQMQSFGEGIEKEIDFKLQEHVKTSYSEAKKWLEKFQPKWDKETYDLKSYENGADAQWLCDNHGEKSGLKRVVFKYK